jgi:ribosomal-protein-alanine N-acetyltransferase
MSTLETERLILRPLEAGDLPAYRKLWGNPAVTRWLSSSEQFGPEVADRALAAWTKHLHEHGYAPWAVVHKETAKLMGHCGLQFLKDWGYPEVLYAFDEEWWGAGYATEGALASVAYGLGALRLDKIGGMAFEDNIASCRVLEKAGLARVGPIHYHGDDLVYFERIGT